MIQEILNRIAGQLQLSQPLQQELQTLFRGFPTDCDRGVHLLRKQAGQVLIYLDDPADSVFLLLRGTVSCMTPMANGAQYRYAQFAPLFFLGEFEAFSACPVYRSTVVCNSACAFLLLPRETYLYWMQHDVQSLYARTCAITTSLGAQARMERERLFCTGLQRLAVHLLTNGRQEPGEPTQYTLRQTLQGIADSIGSSVKTVQRGLTQLVQCGAICRERNRVYFNAEQYAMLLALAFPDEAATEESTRCPIKTETMDKGVCRHE